MIEIVLSTVYIPNGLLYLFSICFILGVWRDYSWDTEDGNVTKTLENYLRRRCSATMSVLLLFAQVSGAYVATAYVRTFWLLKLHQIYTQMYREECKTCLQVGSPFLPPLFPPNSRGHFHRSASPLDFS